MVMARYKMIFYLVRDDLIVNALYDIYTLE